MMGRVSVRIAIDFDGTISDTNRAKAAWIKKRLGQSLEVWQCDRSTCEPIIGVEAYKRLADHVYERVCTLETPAVEGVAKALAQLAQAAELHLVTARPAARLEFAREWADRNGVAQHFRAFHSSAGSSKEEVCRMIAADVLIDDDIRHLRDVKLAGLRRLHMQLDRETTDDSIASVIVCRSWSDVLKAIGHQPGNVLNDA